MISWPPISGSSFPACSLAKTCARTPTNVLPPKSTMDCDRICHTCMVSLKKNQFGTGRSVRRLREQFAGTLNQVRYHKICQEFQKALSTVEGVLTRDPDFSEALLLKAQILWEGFEDRSGAKICLIKILKVEPNKKSPFHRWALALYKEIADSQRNCEVRSQTIECSN
jgi:hypothetical protein